MEKIVLTPTEAAEIIGISENKIRDWCKEGKPFAVRAGRNWKIIKSLLVKWLEEQALEKKNLW